MSRKKPNRATEPKFIPVALIILIVIGVAILVTPSGALVLQFILTNVGALLLTIIGGIVVLYIEYNFFQVRKRGVQRKSTQSGKNSSRQTVLNNILAWFNIKKPASSSLKRVSAYNWDNARKIAVQSFKD